MILILGSSGYLGSAFVTELQAREESFYAAHRQQDNYDVSDCFAELLDRLQPELVINCAAWIPPQSVDLCSKNKTETLMANVYLPGMMADFCGRRNIPLMHLSTGCLFDERREYSETDTPTRGFGGYCGYYVGTKLMAEELVRQHPEHYILRLRLPFDEVDHPRNYLTKLAGFKTVFDHVNSLTHRGDFVKAALDLWEMKAPFGTYHVSNPGWVSARDTVERMMAHRITPATTRQVVKSETTGCTLSTAKLLSTGVKIRSVHEALDDALTNWKI